VAEANQPLQAVQAAAPVQGNLQPGAITITGSPNAQINLGNQNANMTQTFPQKLLGHTFWYWLVHFVIGVLAAVAVEVIVAWFIRR
jgi:hypothetical protein